MNEKSSKKRRPAREHFDFSRPLGASSQMERVAITHRFVELIGDHHLQFVHFDLLDVAVCVYLADRLEKRRGHQARRFHLTIPVREPETWTRPATKFKLEHLLRFLTEDHWHFDFVQAKRERPPHTTTPLLPVHEGAFAVDLFSGGLDSAAGSLQAAFGRTSDRRTLVVSGSTSHTQQRQQQRAVARMNNILRAKTGVGNHFVHLPFIFNLSQDALGDWFVEEKRQEKTQRARGLIFPALGAVVAATLGLESFSVFENGVGAVNLPPIAANLGIDQSRAMHPLNLAHLQNLFAELFEQPMKVINPNLYRTKGQMCQDVQQRGASNLLSETVSCDSYPMRNADGRKAQHCGHCSSCLLRRASATAAGIVEAQGTYLDLLTPEQAKSVTRKTEPLALMNCQAKSLETALKAGTMDALVEAFPEVELARDGLRQLEPQDSPEAIDARLHGLYTRYAHEWRTFHEALTCTPTAA